MSGVMRVYAPAECDAEGVPLDWEMCRYCSGQKTVLRNYGHAAFDGSDTREKQGMQVEVCEMCAGHGSLKAAALDACVTRARRIPADAFPRPRSPRCGGCGHPMSDGTWEDAREWSDEDERLDEMGADPSGLARHYSRCDEGCRHGGPVRIFGSDKKWHERSLAEYDTDRAAEVLREAARLGGHHEVTWRSVDVRCLSWPHDLRPEQLAVLCLRCWAAQS